MRFSTPAAPVNTAPTFTLSQQDLTRPFLQALGDSLPQILVALQSHLTSFGSTTRSLVGTLVSSETSSSSIASFPPLSFPSGSSTGNVAVPSFISTYCTLSNSAFTTPAIVGAPSLLDACGATSGSLSTSTQHSTSSFSLGSLIPSMTVPWATSSLHRPFVVGPGYSMIPEKLVLKIRTGQFIDLADLLAENLKAQEIEPQTFLDEKLLLTSSKKRIQEITDIVTWVEAFTVYLWILHPGGYDTV